jgi:hypothetical protein
MKARRHETGAECVALSALFWSRSYIASLKHGRVSWAGKVTLAVYLLW